MELRKLDKIVEYELEIERLKKEEIIKTYGANPYYLLGINMNIETIATQALRDKMEYLVEDYGEDYKKDRQIYDRMVNVQELDKKIDYLTERVNELDELKSTLEDKILPYRVKSGKYLAIISIIIVATVLLCLVLV